MWDQGGLLLLAEEGLMTCQEQVGMPHKFRLEIWCVLLSEINQKVEKDIQAPGGFSVTGRL